MRLFTGQNLREEDRENGEDGCLEISYSAVPDRLSQYPTFEDGRSPAYRTRCCLTSIRTHEGDSYQALKRNLGFFSSVIATEFPRLCLPSAHFCSLLLSERTDCSHPHFVSSSIIASDVLRATHCGLDRLFHLIVKGRILTLPGTGSRANDNLDRTASVGL
jgi:hypothetical protein